MAMAFWFPALFLKGGEERLDEEDKYTRVGGGGGGGAWGWQERSQFQAVAFLYQAGYEAHHKVEHCFSVEV